MQCTTTKRLHIPGTIPIWCMKKHRSLYITNVQVPVVVISSRLLRQRYKTTTMLSVCLFPPCNTSPTLPNTIHMIIHKLLTPHEWHRSRFDSCAPTTKSTILTLVIKLLTLFGPIQHTSFFCLRIIFRRPHDTKHDSYSQRVSNLNSKHKKTEEPTSWISSKTQHLLAVCWLCYSC